MGLGVKPVKRAASGLQSFWSEGQRCTCAGVPWPISTPGCRPKRTGLVCCPTCPQAGFILVMSAAMLAGLRWTITQVLLQGTPGHGERPRRAVRPAAAAQHPWPCFRARGGAACWSGMQRALALLPRGAAPASSRPGALRTYQPPLWPSPTSPPLSHVSLQAPASTAAPWRCSTS